MLDEFRRARWRREAKRTGETELRTSLGPSPTGHVPREYFTLYTYLRYRCASSVILTFAEVEALLGFELPVSARADAAWWADAAVPSLSHSSAWTETGRSALPALAAEMVAFERR